MRIVLFALTGIGNTVLRALCETGRAPVLIVTRYEAGKYPYYDENQIADEARTLGIPTMLGEDGEKEAIQLSPDVIFSATYHRLISREVIVAAKQRFNLHPSLLPAYPGKNPFYWVLINGETTTGVSIHCLTERFDQGDIVYQQKLLIRGDETQGSLRFALANIAGQATKSFFSKLEANTLAAITQPPSDARGFSQVEEHARAVNLKDTFELVERQVRALTPWPLPVLKEVDGVVMGIKDVRLGVNSPMPAGSVLSIVGNLVRVRLVDSEATFVVKFNKSTGA